MSLDWDKLRVFHSVAEAGSFTHAGNNLNISQSSVSRQISTLEESLGTPLFHRHARGLVLTEQGELLHSATRDVYEKLVMIETQISDIKTQTSGPLKITISGFLGASWLAPKIGDFHRTYPNLRLTVLLDNKILNLSMREADAAIRLYEPSQPDLIKKKLTTTRFHLYASENYLLENGTPEKPKDLAKHILLGYPDSVALPHEYTDWIFELAERPKTNQDDIILMNSMYGILRMVESGAGIACLPDFMAAHSDHLKIVLEDFSPPPIDLFFVYPEERRNSAKIKAFRDFLLAQIQSESIAQS